MPALTIAQRADTIGTFRFVSVFVMETLARWTPLTPEMEIKILFGRHLWEFAQHADALGNRTAELRAGMHYTRRPVAAYQDAMEAVAGLEASHERVHGCYDILLADLARRYRAELEGSDPLLDQPSIRILSRIADDYARLQIEREQMLKGVRLDPVPTPWREALRSRLDGVAGFVDYRPAKEVRA